MNYTTIHTVAAYVTRRKPQANTKTNQIRARASGAVPRARVACVATLADAYSSGTAMV